MTRSGADLALLMLGGFRVLADRASAELATRGHADVRPVHDFALRAVLSGADTASELARRMSVTKQAAAKTLATLESRGWVVRTPDPADGRRVRVEVTARGQALLRDGEAVFDDLRARWEAEVGTATVTRVEKALRGLVGDAAIRLDAPGWIARDA